MQSVNNAEEYWPVEVNMDDITDVVDLFDVMETYDISSKDLGSFEELVERTKLHFWCKKNGNYKKMVLLLFNFPVLSNALTFSLLLFNI